MIEKFQFENCFSNGYAISCLKNYALVSTWDVCKEKCLESNSLKIWRPFWLMDYYNFGLQLNQTVFFTNPLPDEFDNIHFCTNLKYDFENYKWTDMDNEVSFIADWKTKFGDFWNNYPGGYPTQPNEPGRAFHGFEIFLNFSKI